MKVLPYIPPITRNTEAWKEVSQKVDIHPVILREIYLDKYCVGIAVRDFFDLIKRGKFTKENLLEDFDKEFTPEEIAEKEREHAKFEKDNEFTDILYYRLKQLIEVGDGVMSNETKTYIFSGKEYITAGKKYKIKNLNDGRESLTGFTAEIETNLPQEETWTSNYGIYSLWRGGKEIWNWSLEYLKLFQEQNPNYEKEYPEEYKEFLEYSYAGAERYRRGEKMV